LPPAQITEQFGDQCALGIAFVFGNGFLLENLAIEIAAKDEGAIVLDFTPGEAKECYLALK
jgi:hypothetical protein